MNRVRRLFPILLAGCGRLAFDEGSPDARGDRDARHDPDAVIAACPGAILCEDFEDPTYPQWVDHLGTIGPDLGVVHGNARSMRADNTAADLAAALSTTAFDGFTSGELYLRAWFFIPSSLAITKYNLLDADGDVSATGPVFLVDQSELRVYVPSASTTIVTGRLAPRDQWFCIQLHVTAGVAGAVELALNETGIATMSGIDTIPTGGYRTLGIGMLFMPKDQAAGTIYFDDLVASRDPVGCN